MKNLLKTIALSGALVLSAQAASAGLVRGTVVSGGEYQDEMIVKNTDTGEVVTKDQLASVGVDIMDAEEVHEYLGVKYDRYSAKKLGITDVKLEDGETAETDDSASW